MLKGISPLLQPELLKILAEMGHGDELVIGDGNFPAASMGKRCVRCDGHGVNELLDAILQLFPLDDFVAEPVTLMAVVPGTVPDGEPPSGRNSEKPSPSMNRRPRSASSSASISMTAAARRSPRFRPANRRCMPASS